MNDVWINWTLFLAAVGAAVWYYWPNNTRRTRGRPTQRAANTTSRATESTPQWIEDEAAAAKARAPKPKAPKKTVRKAVQEAGEKVEASLSAASDTAGADGDDDLSPVVSPALGASAARAPSGRDVSDMLQSQGPAPSVLRLTPNNEPARPKQQQQRPETPQETKKQRQNRKKAEEAKLQRQEDEKKRQVLLEQQRRTAREARGEPAKNGLQPSKAPATNAWTAVRSSGAVAPINGGQLLDTFDPEVASTASSSENATNGTSTTTDSLSNSTHWGNLPSEEEQVRMAMAENEWTTVPKGRKGKKTKAESTTGDEGSENGTPQQDFSVKAAPPKPIENKPPRSRYEIPEPVSGASHPMDSDWPVV